MGAEQSSQGIQALDEVHQQIQQKQEGANGKIDDQRVVLYRLVRGSSESRWEKVTDDVVWQYYNMNEDGGGKPEWMLEIDGAQIDDHICQEQQFTWDFDQLRVTFMAQGHIWAMKFPNLNRFQQFRDSYQNRLFENVYAVDSSDADARTKVFGDFSDVLMNNNDITTGSNSQHVVGFMDWEEDEDDADVRPITNYTEQGKGNKVQGSPIKSIKMGAGQNSYLVRGSQIDVLNNQVGGIINTDISFNLTPVAAQKSKKKVDDMGIIPEGMILMKGESTMGFLSSKDDTKVFQADIESQRVVAEWQFQKDGVEVPMFDVANDSKDAQLDERSTFLGLDQNRLARWDMRDPDGAVQDLTSELSQAVVQYVQGKDYASKMHFSCMSTSGDGFVVVGSDDGNLRLYNNKEKSLNRASTQIPGLRQPITAVDVTYDGKWIVATTNQYLMVVKTTFKDNKDQMTNGFAARMGKNAPMPRLLKLKPEDAARVNQKSFHDAKFTWITNNDIEERWIVASCGNYTALWNFSKVKKDQPSNMSMGLLTVMDHYHLIPKDQNVVDSVFMHARYAVNSESNDPNLVVATDHDLWTLQNE